MSGLQPGQRPQKGVFKTFTWTEKLCNSCDPKDDAVFGVSSTQDCNRLLHFLMQVAPDLEDCGDLGQLDRLWLLLRGRSPRKHMNHRALATARSSTFKSELTNVICHHASWPSMVLPWRSGKITEPLLASGVVAVVGSNPLIPFFFCS